MKYLVFCILALIFFVFPIYYIPYTIYSALAIDSSPSSTLSEDLKGKLDELKKEIASKSAKLKQEVGLKLQNKAYTGIVKTKTDLSLTLATQTGVKIVTTNQDTIFGNNQKTKQKFSLKNLSEEDYVAALGDIDDNGVLTARKLVLLPPPAISKTYLWGQIISISNKLLTIQTRDLKNVSVAFVNADVKKGGQVGSTDDLNIRDFIILTGVTGKNDIFQAEFIYIIPQGGIIKPKKIATPSAKLASPSAKPKR